MGIPSKQITDEIIRRLINGIESLVEILRNQTSGGVNVDTALRGLNAAQVIMSPRLSQTVPVNAVTPTLLIDNPSANLMQVTFINDDFAVPVYVGDRDLVVPAGDLFDPRQRLTYVLRRGQKKYALSNMGLVNVIVNQSESAYGAVTMDVKTGLVM